MRGFALTVALILVVLMGGCAAWEAITGHSPEGPSGPVPNDATHPPQSEEKPNTGEAEEPPADTFSEMGGSRIAREYLVRRPTFAFDGMEGTLRLVSTDTLRSPYTWAFLFEFDSRHAGYGDRTGKILAQVITPHRARIVVQEGKVASAVMDERWDMMEQRMIENPGTEEAETPSYR